VGARRGVSESGEVDGAPLHPSDDPPDPLDDNGGLVKPSGGLDRGIEAGL